MSFSVCFPCRIGIRSFWRLKMQSRQARRDAPLRYAQTGLERNAEHIAANRKKVNPLIFCLLIRA
jgi:hypothetical protein